MPAAMPSASHQEAELQHEAAHRGRTLIGRVILGDVERHFGDGQRRRELRHRHSPTTGPAVMFGFWPAMSCLSSFVPQLGIFGAEELALGELRRRR